MNICELFRAKKKMDLHDADAASKPLASVGKANDKSEDKLQVVRLSERIAGYQDVFYAARERKLLVVLQGMDTAGKDGAVRGVFGLIDPLGIRGVAFKAPTENEREHDYLWRVHKEVPGQGEIVIFNRSHYEDVLISRVHGWIDEKECQRRYAQIRDFERMLAESGTVLLKFFLHISKEEQKQRLEERISDPDKHWKFDPKDLAERQYWADYQQAYQQAIQETNVDHAPWYVIPANSKTHRNLAIASILVEVLEKMQLTYPPANPDYVKLKVV
ncbi:MAG: polyphosphate kinase 2 family protein [Glaciimonas sp.]|nr:polyphosphate kinase 2 family protein [Glaciimonas sp.]